MRFSSAASPCNEEVRTLGGRHVLFTGKVFVDGEQVFRPRLKEQTKLLGAHFEADENRAVDVLVHGDLRSQIVTDMRRLYGSKLLFVEKMIVEERRHIHVINSRGFESLVHGRNADCLTSRLWPS